MSLMYPSCHGVTWGFGDSLDVAAAIVWPTQKSSNECGIFSNHIFFSGIYHFLSNVSLDFLSSWIICFSWGQFLSKVSILTWPPGIFRSSVDVQNLTVSFDSRVAPNLFFAKEIELKPHLLIQFWVILSTQRHCDLPLRN